MKTCIVGQCVVKATYDDGTQSEKVMTLEEAMTLREHCAEGASEAAKLEIFLKISEADSSHVPLAPNVIPSTAKS